LCECELVRDTSSRSRRGIEAVIQAFKVRNDKAGELSHGVGEKELYWQAEYWIMLMPVDIYRLAKHRRMSGSLEDDWSVICVFHGCWEFFKSRI
jgi:hypothetical protein